jgi:hypothetical protein
MAVEKAGEGESDTRELVTGPRRERHHGQRISRIKPGVHFCRCDVANYVDKMSDKRRRMEHWDNTVF